MEKELLKVKIWELGINMMLSETVKPVRIGRSDSLYVSRPARSTGGERSSWFVFLMLTPAASPLSVSVSLACLPDSLTVSAGLQVCHVCLTSLPCTALCLSVCPPLQPGVASLDRAWVRAAAAKPVARAAATPARRGASPPWVSMVSKTEGWDNLRRLSD